MPRYKLSSPRQFSHRATPTPPGRLPGRRWMYSSPPGMLMRLPLS